MFICYIWKYGSKTAMLSREDENFDSFKKRVVGAYPYTEDWHHQFSEFKEIY